MGNTRDTSDPAAFLRGGGTLGALIASHDWASAGLGPLAAWPAALKTATSIVLRSRAPMAVMWGPDAVMIYNDAYAAFVGDIHPSLLGAKARECWPNAAEFIGQMIVHVLAGGRIIRRDREFIFVRSGQAEHVWMDVAYSPIPDENDRPAGVLALVTETTQRMRAERKAAADTARQRRMFEQAPGFICILDGPQHVIEFVNNTYMRLFGQRALEGTPIREAYPEFRTFLEVLDQVYTAGERYVAQAQRVLVPGEHGNAPEERYLDYVLEPIVEADGQVRGVFCEGFDVTAEVLARRTAEENQRRLSAAIAIARLGAFEWDVEGQELVLDSRAREIFGFPPDKPATLADVRSRIAPEDYERVMTFRRGSSARHQVEFRVRLPDGTSRQVASISDGVIGPDRRVKRIIGVVSDVTERKRADDRQRLLINELNHRVKNTLATVQSIAAQTLRAGSNTSRAREAFEARLIALAAAHDLLTAQGWRGARIADVVASAVAPFESAERPRIRRAGPEVWLRAQHTLVLSMALHELATNALKYGALSRPEGRVSIQWRRVGEDELALSWIERGGPTVEPPSRSGFGSRLLRHSLARELGGEVDFHLEPQGARCDIRFRLRDGDTPPERLLRPGRS